MQEDIDLAIEAAEEGMENSLDHLKREFRKVRSGRAAPDMVADVKVDYYGSLTPVNQVANVKVADARTLVIQPWEKAMIAPIEQAIFAANLGVTPQNDGEVIRLVIPSLTEERRKALVKQASSYAENAKVSVRSARREAIDEIKKAVKDGYPEDAGKRSEDEVQTLTNKYINTVESLYAAKEKDLMTV